MGVLDDAIREHLELKRKHGASEGEIEQQEQEALGAPQRQVAAPVEAQAAEAEVAERPAESVEEEAPPVESEQLEPDPAAVEPEVVEPEPIADDESEAFVEPAESVVDDPQADEPDWDFETEPSAEDDAPASGDTPAQGFERLDDAGPPAEGGEGDVLEETPDFLEETPEHDRLWFEQKPPRDFDFDDDK